MVKYINTFTVYRTRKLFLIFDRVFTPKITATAWASIHKKKIMNHNSRRLERPLLKIKSENITIKSLRGFVAREL